MDLKKLEKQFLQFYGRETNNPIQFFFAPGRVCLIGEHIDYNGGLVMPAAISRGIYAAFRPTDTNVVWMRSTLDPVRDIVFPLDREITYDQKLAWGNYPLGVLHYLREHKVPLNFGCEILFHSDLPVGAGLSSSAAVEVLTAFMFSQQSNELNIDKAELAIISKEAENKYIGVQSGIMDQFASAMGKENHAILLNCNTLDFDWIPAELEDYALVVINSNKKRELANSDYNSRAGEANNALSVLQEHKELENLAEAKLEWIADYLDDPILAKRAKHVVTEQARVEAAALALRNGDLEAFGQLLWKSHQSLRDNYEVTGPELDSIMNAAISHPACIGGKMTGAGFGGCVVALVEQSETTAFINQVLATYKAEAGIQGEAFVTSISDGVRALK